MEVAEGVGLDVADELNEAGEVDVELACMDDDAVDIELLCISNQLTACGYVQTMISSRTVWPMVLFPQVTLPQPYAP